MKRASLLLVSVSALFSVAVAVQAQGMVEFTAAGDGTSWSDPNNWEMLPDPDPSVDPSARFRDPLDPSLVGTARLPVVGERVFLRNAVTTTLSSGTQVLTALYVGGREYRVPATQSGTVTPKGSSTMVMTGGSLCITYGSVWGTNGSLNNCYGTFVIGDYYDGQFFQHNGTVSTDFLEIAVKDPSGDMSVVPTGYYQMDNGLITNSGTTTMRVRVGSSSSSRLPGGAGALVVNGGAILPPETLASGQKRPYVDVASGTLGAQYRAYGTVAINGGSFETENWGIGLTKGDGYLTMTGGTIVNTDMMTAGYGAESNGTITITGGLVDSNLRAGWGSKSGDSYGEINVNGGSVVIGSGLALGWGAANAGGTAFTGHGVLNIRGDGIVDITGTVGDITLGAGDNKSDPNFGPAPGIGKVNVLGGSLSVSGTSTDFILGAPASGNRPGTQSRGTLNVSAGSFVTGSGITYTPLEYMGDGTPGGDRHGVVRVGQNAYCFIGGEFSMNGGTSLQGVHGCSSKLIVEVSATDNTLIQFAEVPFFADTLRVEGVGGWRPKEGDVFTIATNSYIPLNYICFTGEFTTFESNLVGGRQADPNDPNVLLPLWTSGIDPNEVNNYNMTYQGLTAGDANGDHAVNGGDLSLMAEAWLTAGRDWAAADFNGDGIVNGGDLAMMGGNWMWSLSSAPQTPVPEPTVLAVVVLGAVGMIRRRR